MGICESANGGKSLSNVTVKEKPPEIDQTFDYKIGQEHSGVRPSIL